MKTFNILITSSGGDIGANIVNILVQNQQDVKFNIIATDISENIFILDKVNKFYQVPTTNNVNYKDKILQIIKENCIEIIIPVSEKEIYWFCNNIFLFNTLNIKVLINKKNIIDSFLNKLSTNELLNKISVRTPKTYLLNMFENQLNFPLIVKSNYSLNSKALYITTTQQQLDYLKNFLKPQNEYIVQEYIGTINDEYTTAVYNSNNKFEVISFKRNLTGSMTSFARISNEEKLNQYAKQIASYIKLQGSINIQSRKIQDDFYIFEINPRISSTVFIRDHFGFQDLLWWLEDILNLNIIREKKDIQSNGSAILGYQYKFFS